MPRSTKVIALPPFWSLVEAHGDELLVHAGRLAGPDHADHLRAWLYRVTTTTAIDAHRRRRREVPVEEVPAVAVEDDHDDFEALIAPLPEASRVALRLRFVDDLDYEGVAAALGCSTVAARQRVSTAVRTLRERHAA